MKRTIYITGADVPELPGEITKPDYPIEFSYEDDGSLSIDAVAHKYGLPKWEDMHGERPAQLYYRWK